MIRRSLAALDDGQFRRDINEDGRLSETAIQDALIEMNLRRNIAKTLGRYYIGQDRIIERKHRDPGTPDNKIPVPYGRKLVNTVVGYMYKPGMIQVNTDNDVWRELLKDIYWDNDEPGKTSTLGKLSSIFGVGYELHFVDETLRPRFAPIPVEDGLPVYSNDIEPKIVAFLHRYIEHVPGESRQDSIEHIDIYYADAVVYYQTQGVATGFAELRSNGEGAHGYGMVPVAVYTNNDEIAGDFEHILPLIDAYDTLMSDSMNEFDRFAWAYLVLKNLNMTAEQVDDIKVTRVFEVMENGGVDFLTKDIQTQFIEFMRGWIREEIHKQTHIPDMADHSFAGQQSGIAIRFKLNDLENIASVKQIGFERGLYQRLRLLNGYFRTAGISPGDVRDVWFTFNRNIPANYEEQARIVSTLRGHVSHKTLLDEVVSFVDDSDAELERVALETDPMMGAFNELQGQEAEEAEGEIGAES